MAKMVFLTVNNFLKCVFKYTDPKNIYVSIVFQAESEPKNNEIFLGGFLQKTKKACSKVVFKTLFLTLFFALVL